MMEQSPEQPLSSVNVEVVEDSPAPQPSPRRLMSYIGEEEWGVTLPSTYHAIQLTQGQAQFGELSPDRVARYVYSASVVQLRHHLRVVPPLGL